MCTLAPDAVVSRPLMCRTMPFLALLRCARKGTACGAQGEPCGAHTHRCWLQLPGGFSRVGATPANPSNGLLTRLPAAPSHAPSQAPEHNASSAAAEQLQPRGPSSLPTDACCCQRAADCQCWLCIPLSTQPPERCAVGLAPKPRSWSLTRSSQPASCVPRCTANVPRHAVPAATSALAAVLEPGIQEPPHLAASRLRQEGALRSGAADSEPQVVLPACCERRPRRLRRLLQRWGKFLFCPSALCASSGRYVSHGQPLVAVGVPFAIASWACSAKALLVCISLGLPIYVSLDVHI